LDPYRQGKRLSKVAAAADRNGDWREESHESDNKGDT
jgi:hypothetical protein